MDKIAFEECDFYFRDQGIKASLFRGPVLSKSQYDSNALNYKWYYKLTKSDTVSISVTVHRRSASGEPDIHLMGPTVVWNEIIGTSARK